MSKQITLNSIIVMLINILDHLTTIRAFVKKGLGIASYLWKF